MIPDGALFQLLRLASPALPVGAYCYSQGLESAIDLGLVTGAAEARGWLSALLDGPVAHFDAPIVARAWRAQAARDEYALGRLNALYLASRDTAEQRQETVQMGHSLRRLVLALPEGADAGWPGDENADLCFPIAWAIAAGCFGIGEHQTVCAWLFGWLENQVIVLMKALPLGHTAGQQLLSALLPSLGRAAQLAVALEESELSGLAPTQAWVAMRHESQYSRLFRS